MKKNIIFVLSCYIVSCIFGIIIWNIPKQDLPTNPIQILLTLFLMTTPAIIAFIVEKQKFLETAKKYQLNFKNFKWAQTIKYLIATTFFIPLLIILYGYFFGNILSVEPFGKLATNYNDLSPEILKNLPSFLKNDFFIFIIILIIFIASLFSAITLNGIIALGEEIGWRGFLWSNINLSFFNKNILIGIIWGLWHAPIILCGHNYPNHKFLGIIMMIFLCIAMSFYFSRALLKSQSLFVVGALHGGINAVSQTLFFLQINYNELFGPVGLLMILAVLTVFFTDYILSKT